MRELPETLALSFGDISDQYTLVPFDIESFSQTFHYRKLLKPSLAEYAVKRKFQQDIAKDCLKNYH